VISVGDRKNTVSDCPIVKVQRLPTTPKWPESSDPAHASPWMLVTLGPEGYAMVEEVIEMPIVRGGAGIQQFHRLSELNLVTSEPAIPKSSPARGGRR